MSTVKMGEVPTLFESPSHCCGCGSCAAGCPKGAITMSEGKDGFVLPVIDSDLCVGCGACARACGLNRGIGSNSAGPFYAAAGRGDVSESASGGVFGAVAREVISAGGVAYGAAYECEGNTLRVLHRRAASVDELRPLLNSKYVQSDAGVCFVDVKADIREGRQVLFCGTPCQVAGLKGFLGRYYENLTTVDLVCHGVPSGRMFSDCVEDYGNQFGSPVVDFRFRCKREGWGHSLLLLLLEDGREVTIPAAKSPYYDMFLNLKTLRDSCYRCPYAGRFRAGDLTIGDFWGVEINRPDVLNDSTKFSQTKGISCLLVNNSHGKDFIDSCDSLDLYPVDFDDIARGNDQLRHPSNLPSDRGLYIEAFAKGGWRSVRKLYFRRERGLKYHSKRILRALLPASFISFAKSFRSR
ncbi:Coenzyme F420 hydrogenase/dehydrogenase, beta subunit C-terminal domain [Collinsella sp. CLA-ER-H3]|uniref:Coenzyme F420 hydrogenase/dehydrogenase, beta subunit C-terminal domain n=1 Tax=Collinsella sp. CLA-ER-H3 TaxID=3136226 RepID=UPI0032C05124